MMDASLRLLRRAALFAAPAAALLLVCALAPLQPSAAEEKNEGLRKAPGSFRPSASRPLRGPIRLEHAKLPKVKKQDLDAAIERGLAWLAAHQEPEGYWGVKSHAAWCHGKKLPANQQLATVGFEGFAISMTGLALNAFFEAGYSPVGDHPYAKVMRKALDVLAALVDEKGGIGVPEKPAAPDTIAGRWGFDHGLACWALCRAAAMTGSYRYEVAARATLEYSNHMRNPWFAWRYGIKPGDNDTACTGVMLLGPAVAREMAALAETRGVWSPLSEPQGMFDGAKAWLDKVTDPDYGRVGYVQRGTGPTRYKDLHGPGFEPERSEAMTAVGSVIRLWLGEDPRKSKILKLAFELVHKVDTRIGPHGRQDEWHLWWAAEFMRHLAFGTKGRASSHVAAWRSLVVQQVLQQQQRSGDIARELGSWAPEDSCWGQFGGRVYTTSIALMTLCRAGYDWTTGAEPGAAIIADRKADVGLRLDAMERAGARPDTSIKKALRKALNDKSVAIRIGAADAIARVGTAGKSARGTLGKRLAKESDARARQAQVWAFHRISAGHESLTKILQPFAKDKDAGVRFLVAHALAAVAKKQPTAQRDELDPRTSAHDVLLAAERAGWLHPEGRDKRVAELRWHLLDANNLPSSLAQRADQRLGFASHARLAEPGVLEAIEAAAAPQVWSEAPLATLWKLHDAARASVQGTDAGATVLRAVLDLEFARRIKAEDDPEVILPKGETRRERFGHARKAVARSQAELKALQERLAGAEHDATRGAAQLVSAYLSARNFDLFDTPNAADALVMLTSAVELMGVIDAYESTTAGRCLAVQLLEIGVTLGRLRPVKGALARRLSDFLDRALRVSMSEAQTVDGRRVVVRALSVMADALVATRNTKYPDGDVYVWVLRDKARMPKLGRTGQEVDLLLSWAAFFKHVGKPAIAKSLGLEAVTHANSLADKARSEKAAAFVKGLGAK